MSDHLKRLAAEAAASAELRSGMKLGLGTGSTAKHFVDIVGERIRAGETYLCVPTSEATRRQAESLGIPLTSLDEAGELDLTVDGADEFDPALNLIKGGGGAHLREKMVAANSRRMIVIADASKRVARLGAFPLPLEITPFAQGTTVRAIARAFADSGIRAEIRQRHRPDGSPYISDNGNLIFDAVNDGIADAAALADRLDRIPGLVEHGLFVGLCFAVYLGAEEGVAVIGKKT
ncbi:MAG: ribose-5-phosphate isomerase RpiA [Beijerinckiaceae bacterium]|nr:ribose-5-phosphate isomerase RpiA [Beijerinckiaceae bacterium]